jgi:hypothetical protein
LLALGYGLGFRGAGHLVWAYLLAGMAYASIFYFVFALGKRLVSPQIGNWAMVLVFVSGYFAWGIWSGMENALFSALLLAVLYFLTEQEWPPLFLTMGFLALCRPEGGIIAIGITFFVLSFIARRSAWPVFLSPMGLLGMGFCLVSIVLPTWINWFMTGATAGNSLIAKSLLHSPILTLGEKGELWLENLSGIGLFLLGSPTYSPYPGEFILPGTLLLAGLGTVGLALGEKEDRWWRAGAVGLPLVTVFCAIATLEVWSLHSFRYLHPYLPVLYLLALAGAERLAEWAGDRQKITTMAFCLLATLVSLPAWPQWLANSINQSLTIAEKQKETARWLNHNLKKGDRVAINDAGALAYYGQFPLLDLVGLVSNDTAIPYRLGEGGLYERLEQIPKSARPQYAAVFPSWFPQLANKYDVFHRPRVTFYDPFDPSFEKTVYEVNWEYAGMEDQPRPATLQPGWEVRDALDVADLESEASHLYRVKNAGNRFPPISIPFRRNFGYHDEIDERWPDIEEEQEELIPLLREQGILNQYDIVDAGRRITGEEVFCLSNLAPGQDAYLIIRTCDGIGDHPMFTYRLRVHGNGYFLGDWVLSETPWNWMESVFVIPGGIIHEPTVLVRIQNLGTRNFGYYDSFYYWICQEGSG